MADVPEDSCINLIKMRFIDGTLYFEAEDDENLEPDHFGRLEAKTSILRNVDNQILMISQENQPVFEDMTDLDCQENASQVRFIIYYYKDSLNKRPGHLPVTISVRHRRLSTLSCKDKILSFPEIEPPADIDDEKSDIIFFMKRVIGFNNKMEFESSLYEGHFLACKRENDLFKLILKKKDENGAQGRPKDTTVIFNVINTK
ncbi:interleukin-18 [Sorex araneus]|uniref:interleukin-18 n=1 Tax=Sorex araneus TaxID=42254 RepID=UPI002433D2E1|nr:interleukin-18 [Sorex araneus]